MNENLRNLRKLRKWEKLVVGMWWWVVGLVVVEREREGGKGEGREEGEGGAEGVEGYEMKRMVMMKVKDINV